VSFCEFSTPLSFAVCNFYECTVYVSVSRCHKAGDCQSGDSAAAPEITSHSPGDVYQELSMTSRTEPVYNQLQRSP